SLTDKTVKSYFDAAVTVSNIAKNNDWKNRLSFQVSNTALTGTFDIDVYYAAHKAPSAPLGGAQFLVRYVKGDGETDDFGKSLQGMQIVKTDSPNGREPGS